MPDELRLPPSDPATARLGPSGEIAGGGYTLPASSPASDERPTLPPAAGETPVAPPLPAFEEPVAEQTAERPTVSLTERIRRITAAGGFDTLPEEWGDEDGDWPTVKSDDPFEVLFLDYRQSAAITPTLIGKHAHLLGEFWRQKVARMNMGVNRATFARLYGDLTPYPDRVERAYRALVDDAGIAREAAKRHTMRRSAGEAKIADLVDIALEDGELTPNETTRILRRAEDALLSPEEAAAYIERALRQGGFRPFGTPSGRTFADELRSVRWMTVAKAAEEEKVAAETARLRAAAHAATAVRAFKFERHSVTTIEELIDVADAVPDEAQEYLFAGNIETWLSASMNDASLAKSARDARAQWAREQARGLERFVRTMSVRVGRPAAPVITPDPDAISLGVLPVGARRSASVRPILSGRRIAWGTITRDPSLVGLKLPSTFDGSVMIPMVLDTLEVPPGHYAGNITLQPEGGAPAVYRLEYTVEPLTLTAEPAQIDFGAISFGATRSAKVHVSVAPTGGRIAGSVTMESTQAGATAEGTVNPDGADVTVQIDTRTMPTGRKYRAVVHVATNAGTVYVPVTYHVRLRTWLVIAWTLGLALVGGVVLGGARIGLGIVSNRESRWLLRFGDAPHLTSVVIALVALLPGYWWLARRRRAALAKKAKQS